MNSTMTLQLSNKERAALVKERNIPFLLNEQAVSDLIERIAGKAYADIFVLRSMEAMETGIDSYRLSDMADGRILIEATGGVAAATAFRWYMEERCNSYVGPLTRRLCFPVVPPAVGMVKTGKAVGIYRYFLNFCTYGYTLAFWQWNEWQKLLDWMMLAGYNLVLNPLGNESVWLLALERMGYTKEEVRQFLCSPTIYPWQCMMNLTSWAGAAPDHWYEERLQLSRRINDYLKSFGAGVVLPGWSGMVPADFKAHFPESHPLDQGLWEGMKRPSLLLPGDSLFDAMADSYYAVTKELLGNGFHYFSTDPFHEGGDSSTVDLKSYALRCLEKMGIVSEQPVWFLQGWQDNPLREMLRAMPVEHVLIGNLRACDRFDGGDDFADYPWLYCTVNNFGGQRVTRGNMNKMLHQTAEVLCSENYTGVGLGIVPEGIETDEILFDIFADITMDSECTQDADAWLERRLRIRYGDCNKDTLEGWKILRDKVYIADNESSPRGSGLCARPTLTNRKTTIASTDTFNYDTSCLKKALQLLMKEFAAMPLSEPYRLDIADLMRQAVANSSWTAVEMLQNAFIAGNEAEFEQAVDSLMEHFDVQEQLLSCNRQTMLGPWLVRARENGTTPTEKAYFDFLARSIITLWGDENGAQSLCDYAAREWDGMLQDFYRPRWQSFINMLRMSFVTGNEPMEYSRYDAEYFFTTLSKEYPATPYGNLSDALRQAMRLVL